jgi:serine/threonine protein phosphatase PrpC
MLYGYNQVNGRGRPTEDRIVFKKLAEDCDLFAVFDGHAGSAVVRHTVDLLPKRIQAAIEAAGGPVILRNLKGLADLLRQAFLDHDKELARSASKMRDSGSTATVVIVTATHIVFAYCGDSPAFMINPFTGAILKEIGKHEPALLGETERIKAAGGTVEIDEYGVPRVDGALMVSRAFGDFSLKWPEGKPPPFEADWTRMKVTAAPDVMVWERPSVGLLAIMSDGLVETNTNQLKPHAHVAKDIQVALKTATFNLMEAAKAVNANHVLQATTLDGMAPHQYDGDDLSLILVDVGQRNTIAAQAEGGGAAAAVAAAASAAAAAASQKPKTRKARHERRNKTAKRGAALPRLQVVASSPRISYVRQGT